MMSFTEGDLVRILNENSIEVGVGIYIRTLVPGEEGIGYDQLKRESDILEPGSEGLFYALPQMWHNCIFYGGHLINLNTNIYTLIRLEDSDS